MVERQAFYKTRCLHNISPRVLDVICLEVFFEALKQRDAYASASGSTPRIVGEDSEIYYSFHQLFFTLVRYYPFPKLVVYKNDKFRRVYIAYESLVGLFLPATFYSDASIGINTALIDGLGRDFHEQFVFTWLNHVWIVLGDLYLIIFQL